MTVYGRSRNPGQTDPGVLVRASGGSVTDSGGYRIHTFTTSGDFVVTATKATADGISEMVFKFNQPVNSPHYHFFVGSPQFLAYPLERMAASRPAANP